MKQVLHIFAKDTRRMRVEIMVSLALLVGLVANAPQRWSPDAMLWGNTVSFSPRGLGLAFLSPMIPFLVALSWWVLIGPVIHEERLVGDRQFWLTRPYEWHKLLAAKALFILAYVYAPLLVSQCIILVEAGFQPFAHLPGIFYNLLILTAFILSLAVLAALTRNFAHMTLVLLGVVVGLTALSSLAQFFGGPDVKSPVAGSINGVLLFAGCATALVMQYASRRTTRTWIVLGVTLALTEVVGCIAPDQVLMDRTYPAAQNPGWNCGIK